MKAVVVPVEVNSVDEACSLGDRIVADPLFNQEIDMLEIRVDSIKELTHEGVKKVVGHNDVRKIFTLRAVNEGGSRNWASQDVLNDWVKYEEARIAFNILAAELGVYAIDSEYSNLQRKNEGGMIWQPFFDKVKEGGIILVPSAHDFSKTPSRRVLERSYDGMKKLVTGQGLKAVIKFAMMINKEYDKESLAHIAQLAKNEKIAISVVGMAKTKKTEEFAFETRKTFPYLYETKWLYAAYKKANAPGQISFKEVREYQRQRAT